MQRTSATVSNLLRRTSALAVALLPLGACQGGDPSAESASPVGEPIVAFYAGADAQKGAVAVGREKPGQSFYLGVRRDVLDERWFLSAYLKNLYPGTASHGARTLGTRVVSFKVQNDTLFVFDVDDRKRQSETIDPESLIEAYPLVDEKKLGSAGAGGDYVVFDPAKGLNRFSVLNDGQFNNTALYPSPIEVEASYSQNFRALADGVTFEQVFSGHAVETRPVYDGPNLEPNDHRLTGTLGFALRRYAEGEGFESKVLPGKRFFFRGQPRLTPDAPSLSERPVLRWNIAPGGAPVRWVISPGLVTAQAERYPDYDLVGAVKRGIESWNEAFGFEALSAEIAVPEQSFTDDDVNYFIFDENLDSYGAFADFRPNPNSGEIRGASVYFPEYFVADAEFLFSDDPAATPSPLGRPGLAPTGRFSWGPLNQDALCALTPASGLYARQAAAGGLTKKEKIERYVSHVAAHEIGHTLGLRHNFKGSLLGPSSSVMEYVANDDSVFVPGPAPYDVAALRYLYGLSAAPPTQPFCTDEDIASDALCNRNDVGADPLAQSLTPAYHEMLGAFARGEFFPLEDSFLSFDMPLVTGELADYLRAAPPAAKLAAWQGLFAPLRPPFDPAFVPENVDLWARRLLGFLALDDQFDDVYADISSPIEPDPLLTTQMGADLRDLIVDGDGFWAVETRVKAVKLLKLLRAPAALLALEDARASLVAALPALDGEAKAVAADLVDQIDDVTAPYFD